MSGVYVIEGDSKTTPMSSSKWRDEDKEHKPDGG
jgi:hypothetical protein